MAETKKNTPSSVYPFGVYVHVPFCARRCGYCDFNTYTAGELGGSTSPQAWLDASHTEMALAATRLAQQFSTTPTIDTVFIGGGTPSLLGADGLRRVLDGLKEHFDLASDAEITTESNPESTSPAFFAALKSAGFTRISLGMQSAAQHVLTVLDRAHTPGRASNAAREAAQAGFSHVNLDLIYGTPGETDDDLRASLDTVIEAQVDHVSAYALIVEEGTALARKVRRGELPRPDDDVLAHRYELIDQHLIDAGLQWYEVSNWALPGGECRHNTGYWSTGQWWGIGPGAHSFVDGVRWWNIKHPARYAQALDERRLPIAGQETLTARERHIEKVMLALRMRSGLPSSDLDDEERRRADTAVDGGLLVMDGSAYVLTDRGRLLADGVVRELLA